MDLAKQQYEDAKLDADKAFSAWLSISKELSTIRDNEDKKNCQTRLKEAFVVLQDKNKTKSNAASNLSVVKTDELEKKTRRARGKRIKGKDSKGERECKAVIERLTGREFVKVRPSFLFNYITEQNLELDLYNEELKLAVEFNGEQHYKYTPYFHRNKEAYYCGRYRDDMKRRLCDKEGVILISVSYKEKDVETYLSEQIKKLNALEIITHR